MRFKILIGILAVCLCCSVSPVMAQHDGVDQDAACRAIQLDAQAAVQAGMPFRNHGQMIRTAAHVVDAAETDGLIDAACASCIVSQFARGIVIADQTACGPDSEEPNPECAGADCQTFLPCNEPNNCSAPVCATTSDGLGVCVEGTTPCAGLSLCPNGSDDCPVGNICAVNTCCGDPVCVPPEAFCELNSAASTSAASAPVTGTRTISGIIE